MRFILHIKECIFIKGSLIWATYPEGFRLGKCLTVSDSLILFWRNSMIVWRSRGNSRWVSIVSPNLFLGSPSQYSWKYIYNKCDLWDIYMMDSKINNIIDDNDIYKPLVWDMKWSPGFCKYHSWRYPRNSRLQCLRLIANLRRENQSELSRQNDIFHLLSCFSLVATQAVIYLLSG